MNFGNFCIEARFASRGLSGNPTLIQGAGVYWKPVWHVLESTVELALVNANEVKNLPGRKSDVNDAQWLADLLAHGLLKRSFVPEREVEELRQLTRTRTQLVREASRHAARIDKVLQDANIKMRSVLTKYHRIRGRAGKMKAIVAVAHAMLVAIYHMLTNKKVYRDLGENFFVQRDAERVKRACTRQLERLGYAVELRSATASETVSAAVVVTC